jgi:nicotinate-nucleotide adenylyltransferase
MNMPNSQQHKKLNNETLNKLEKTMFKRIGVLGGTFDPIHFGHITPALENTKWLSLDHFYFLPAHIPPHKEQTSANAEHRLSMVKLVCQQYPALQLDGRELLKDSPSYTVESVKDISEQYESAQIFFIIGMDSFLTLTSWHQWENILKHCHLVVNTRPEYDFSKLPKACHQLLSKYFIDDINVLNSIKSGNIIFHQHANINISSTDIRHELEANTYDENKLLPDVIKYIKQHQLYK